MNKLTSRGVSWSFKTLFTLVLMVLVARVSDARVDSSKSVAQQSGALTYTGTMLHTFDPYTDGGMPTRAWSRTVPAICMGQPMRAGPICGTVVLFSS